MTTTALPTLVPAHSHGLDDTVGYDVIRTTQDGGRVQLEVTAVVEGAHRAGEALQAAKAHRTAGGLVWGYTLPRYADGCREAGHVASRMGVDLVADAGA